MFIEISPLGLGSIHLSNSEVVELVHISNGFDNAVTYCSPDARKLPRVPVELMAGTRYDIQIESHYDRSIETLRYSAKELSKCTSANDLLERAQALCDWVYITIRP